MKKYKYVLQFKDKPVSRYILNSSLDYAWRYTPSKNNFMNYNVHVLGPQQSHLKNSLYDKCLQQQMDANGEKFESLSVYDKYLDDTDQEPNFRNLLSAYYILIYTQRVVKSTNVIQQTNISRGMVYEQMFEKSTEKYNAANNLARFEAGMFSANFASKCLSLGADVSYIGCMPFKLEKWSEDEWSFITDPPIIIQLVGHGDIYKKDVINPSDDKKPEFNEVIKFL